MPELPEVSYFRNYVNDTALHQEIIKLEVKSPKVVQHSSETFEDALLHQQFQKAIRHGKYVMLQAGNGKVLVFHFGMSGYFEYLKHDAEYKHAHFTVFFEDNAKLCFICPRKFGKVYLAESMQAFKEAHKLGIDAMDLDLTAFQELLSGKSGSIKGALMDQHLLAGIGNMYADEMLFQAKIHPKTSINSLNKVEIDALFNQVHPVLETVIKSQAHETSLPKNYLTPHRKPGAHCPNNNGTIKKIKVSGRSTYFCPQCQSEK